MKIKHLIFDFDGTLVNSLPLFIELVNSQAVRYRFKKTSADEVRNQSARTFLKHVGIPWYRLPLLLKKGKEDYAINASTLLPCGNILSVAEELRGRRYQLGILTSNLKSTVEEFLTRNHCRAFSVIRAERRLFGKARALHKMIRAMGVDKSEVAYIGDEVRDIDAARKCGVSVVSVAWGYNGPALLSKHAPDALMEAPDQLKSFFN